MAIPRDSNCTVYNAVQLAGDSVKIGAESFTVNLVDANGDILHAQGLTVPTDGGAGFAKGCLFIDTDVSTGTTGLNCNKGTNLSCAFTAVTQA